MLDQPFGAYGYGIAIGVIGIMLALSGIALGLGYALNDKRLREFGRGEVYQAVINGALVGGLLAAFSANGIVSRFIYAATMSNGVSMQCPAYLFQNAAICFAYNYLAGSGYTLSNTYHPSILSATLVMITALLGLSTVLGMIGGLKLSILVVTISFAQVVNPILSQVQYLIRILSTVAIGATVQSSILIFISVSSLSVILPAGLILRSFYPTRKLGGFLIALVIGLYVVLPLSYVLDAIIANSYSVNVNSTGVQQLTVSAASVESTALGNLHPVATNSMLYSIGSDFISPLNSLADAFQGIVSSLFSAVAYLIVYTFILPAFSLVITGISIRELSSLLGSDTSFDILAVL